MAGEQRTVAYEVHVLKRGRWEIHASYPEEQKRIAVRDAKSLDRISNIDGVKVIKDTYSSDSGTSKDEVIYLSPAMVQAERAKREMSSEPKQSTQFEPSALRMQPPVFQPDSRDGWERDERKKRSTKSSGGTESVGFAIVLKLILITFVSIVISGIVVALATLLIRDSSGLASALSGDARANLLFALFVITFLISAFPMALRYLGREQKRAARTVERPAAGRKMVPTEPDMDPDPVPEEEADLEEAPPTPYVDTRVLLTMRARLNQATRIRLILEPQRYFENLPKPSELLPPDVRAVADEMVEFLRAVLNPVEQTKAKLDNVTRFGISLFAAGAVEHLGRARGLGEPGINRLLSHAVQSMGFRKMQADSFAQKCEQYLLADARYMQMYGQGRAAMEGRKDDPSSHDPDVLVRALEEWNRPKATDEQVPKLVAVMFTDIVGSTDMTRVQGDQEAQELVRLHNRIVRKAIQAQAGREVKHTGDGIMASFGSISGSVDAAMAIQRDLKAHNDKNPNRKLGLRIGINAGEPIAEDDDLFGTPVQLASRITDHADAGQIFVSDTMKGLCAGKKVPFVSRGTFKPKGIAEDVQIWEVIWDELAAAKAETEQAQPNNEALPESGMDLAEQGPTQADEMPSNGADKAVGGDTASPPEADKEATASGDSRGGVQSGSETADASVTQEVEPQRKTMIKDAAQPKPAETTTESLQESSQKESVPQASTSSAEDVDGKPQAQ